MDDGTEKILEGKGQPVFPKFSSSTAMAFKTSDHEKWHGEHTVYLYWKVFLERRLFGLSKIRLEVHIEIKVSEIFTRT
jgi:hypothetical protein